jgi:LPXTG-motif cell wall-anchored protein
MTKGKKHLKQKILSLICLLLILPASAAYADETDYKSQGNVGFTGAWTEPAPPELPNTNEVATVSPLLPRTGEGASASFGTSAVGVLLLLMIVAYRKKKKDSEINKLV